MEEQLEVYDMASNLLGVEPRQKFYDEARADGRKTGFINKKLKGVRLLLMNSHGRIYLQKRSKAKMHNPGYYDKTVGGHVTAGDSFDLTIIKECAEELGFPMSVLPSEEFNNAICNTDLSVVGVCHALEYVDNYEVHNDYDETMIKQTFMNTTYIGYFDGAIRFVDGESCGIEVFSLEELEHDIQENPNKFTEDIKSMITKYRDQLVPIA